MFLDRAVLTQLSWGSLVGQSAIAATMLVYAFFGHSLAESMLGRFLGMEAKESGTPVLRRDALENHQVRRPRH